MYKDEGGNAVDSEMGGDDVLGINKDDDDDKKNINDNNIDNSNIPPQAIPPSDE